MLSVGVIMATCHISRKCGEVDEIYIEELLEHTNYGKHGYGWFRYP